MVRRTAPPRIPSTESICLTGRKGWFCWKTRQSEKDLPMRQALSTLMEVFFPFRGRMRLFVAYRCCVRRRGHGWCKCIKYVPTAWSHRHGGERYGEGDCPWRRRGEIRLSRRESSFSERKSRIGTGTLKSHTLSERRQLCKRLFPTNIWNGLCRHCRHKGAD